MFNKNPLTSRSRVLGPMKVQSLKIKYEPPAAKDRVMRGYNKYNRKKKRKQQKQLLLISYSWSYFDRMFSSLCLISANGGR